MGSNMEHFFVLDYFMPVYKTLNWSVGRGIIRGGVFKSFEDAIDAFPKEMSKLLANYPEGHSALGGEWKVVE